MLKTKIIPYTLRFKQPAGTSRGIYHEHRVWYVVVSDASDAARWGVGECAPLPNLSCDYPADYEQTLAHFCRKLEADGHLDREPLRPYPSILFGLETAVRQLERGSFRLWDTDFSAGKRGIPINGLIWMGSYDDMLRQVDEKLEQGFRCIKLKIGAIDFERELALLRRIRSRYGADQITLRVDANGAFTSGEAMARLQRLAELDLHSIEQPIRSGQWDEMARLTAQTPLPIALDEELIGVHAPEEKKRLLKTIKPHYIVLKPTLHGGLYGTAEWIALAEAMGIGWWITSALESNVGLNAIAQWCAKLNNPLPQGLGTGALYTNNVAMPLRIQGDCLWFDGEGVAAVTEPVEVVEATFNK